MTTRPYRGFADLIRRRRKELGRTLDDIATKAELSLPYISELERGVKQPPLGDVLGKLAKALELDWASLEREARLSRRTVEIDLEGTGEPHRRLAVLLHRKIEEGCTDDEAERAIAALEKTWKLED